MDDVVIVGGARTPIGTFGGSLKDVRCRDLGTIAVKSALRRTGTEPGDVDHVIFGHVIQDTYEASNIARDITLAAGIPDTVPAFTLNRLCGSGLEAINMAAQFIMTGNADVVVAGGAESMSRAPYLLKNSRFGCRMGNDTVYDSMLATLTDSTYHIHMGETAENLAEKLSITREEQDQFALESQQKALRAIAGGKFKGEIEPVPVRSRKEELLFAVDEHPRETTLTALATLPTVFRKGGSVTPGNASGLNDAAAAVVLMSARRAEALGLKPLARIVSFAASGVDPKIMGYGPVPATKKALSRAGINLSDIELIEANEAFAAQYLAVEKELGINRQIVNPNGGAIALGHPLGATGAILTIKLMNELQRQQKKLGLITLCVGGGQGVSSIIESI
ncbi:MAG: acetyl-CoA C-acetyltransferase [Bacillota bacterium]|nr:acetyl-CoA C-acetyltransferase [Bacillota bacterium]MDW7685034.1 acetyl-CoA C-acetyltransferase [Bacillota bacterium]